MTAAEIKEFSDHDLQDKIVELKTDLANMKFQHSISGLENPVNIKLIRRDVARLLTEVNMRANNSEK